MKTQNTPNTFPVVAATCAALTMGVSFAAAPATLAHRWTFNNTLNDSVTTGASNAVIIDPDNNAATGGAVDLTTTPGQVTFGGGGKDQSSYVKLGTNLLAGKTGAVTIELWATQTAIQNWSRIWDFGTDNTQYLMMSWTRGTTANQDTLTWKNNVEVASNDKNAPYILGTEYHIALVIEPGAGPGGQTRLTQYAAPSSATTMGAPKAVVNTTYTLATLADPNDYLGRSQWPDNTAQATYNEFRIWNGAMVQQELDARQVAGPDSTTTLDTDGDGMPDWWENLHGLNPAVNDAAGDADHDGSTNLQEYLAGSDPQDPNSGAADVDGDGLPDAWEIAHFGGLGETASGDPDGDGATNLQEYQANTDPLNPLSFPDTDGDGMNDVWEKKYFAGSLAQTASGDADGDGFTNLEEFLAGSNPNSAASTPVLNTLLHRWSFNNSLNDSVTTGASNATIVDPDSNAAVGGTADLTTVPGAVFMAGGDRATSAYVSLGSNLLKGQTSPVTIEMWATTYTTKSWSRVFDFGNSDSEYILTSWNNNGNQGMNRVSWKKGNEIYGDNSTVPFNLGTRYHIVVTIEPPAGTRKKTRMTLYIADSTSGTGATTMGPALATVYTDYNITNLGDLNDWLGRSEYAGDLTANASYDEVRIWSGLMPAGIRDIFQVQGPDNIALADTDNDKLPDAWEMATFGNLTQTGTGDFDNDGASNLKELAASTDPKDKNYTPADTDGDGLPDSWEYQYFGDLTQDKFGDFDGDIATNGDEYTAGTNPADKTKFPDTDGDGIADAWETLFFPNLTTATATSDYDGDGVTDKQEFLNGTDPTDPLSPGAANGDGDNDGLDDWWEVQNFGNITSQGPSGDPDHDGFTNLQEFLAGSDPNSATSTPNDVNGDGFADQVQTNELKAVGTSGVKDSTGQFTGLVRLPGSGTDATYSPNDPNLKLNITGTGTLGITAQHADFFGQVGMPQLEALGIPLSSMGIDSTSDFRFRVRYANMPAISGNDQVGVFVGNSTTSVTRFGHIDVAAAYGTNTNGTTDTGSVRTNAALTLKSMILEVTRVGGVWTMTVNGIDVTPSDQPVFLNSANDLIAGVFALDLSGAKATSYVDSMTLIKLGAAPVANPDSDNDGMDDAWEMANFGNLNQTGTGDFDGDGVSNLTEFAFDGNPKSVGNRGVITTALTDTDGNGKKELTMTVAVRTGATFAAGANGSMTATVGGITYTIQGTTDLVNFTAAVSEVGTPVAGDAGYQLHTFRLVASDGLVGKGFLRASVTK